MSLDSIYRDGRYYDLEFRHWNIDITCYQGLVKEAPGSVLDLACGTGRVTLPIARLGVPVIGLDLIPAMLLDRVLTESGFEIVCKFGSFDRKPFTADSRRQIFVCKLG